MSCGVRIELHSISAALQKDIDRIDALWCDGLKRFKGPFLAGGKFGGVDAFYAPVVSRVHTYGLKLGEPAAAYAARIMALPAMQRWYDAALREPWRDVPHESDILGSGRLLQDLRGAAANG